MRASILRKVEESNRTSLQFFEAHAERLEACVQDLGRVFRGGGKLLVMGNGGSACDAQHLAVEFQHPILEKRKALPAVSLCNDLATITAVGNDMDFSHVFVRQLDTQARPGDAILGISTSGASANVNRALRHARQQGLLTIGFAGRDGGSLADVCAYAFVVPSWSVHRIQECHTLLLHLLWDQLHVAMGEDDVL